MTETPDRLGASEALDQILHPESVVVIGANEAVGKMTSAPIRNLLRHGYGGRIHIVNPGRDDVFGVRCYKRVTDLPEIPDTAIVVIGAKRVPGVLEECADFGIRTATVIAGGFDEGGAANVSPVPADELKAVLDRTGLRLLGPNTAGLLNLLDSYVPRGSFNHPLDVSVGRVGLVTQSGGLCNVLLNRANANHLGVGIAVAAGNQLDLTLWDLGEYVLDDPRIDCLMMVVEGIKESRRFVEVAIRARELNKPLVLYKLGATDLGRRIVETHSGALAGSAQVQRAIMAELGVIQSDDLDQLWEIASLATSWGRPPGSLDRLGVITLSGGDAAILADETAGLDIAMPPPSQAVLEQFAKSFPDVYVDNPYDSQAATVAVGQDTWAEQIGLFSSDENYDAVLVLLPVLATPDTVPVIAPHIEGVRRSGQPRAAVSIWRAGMSTEPAVAALREAGLPIFDNSARAVRALSKYSQYCRRLKIPVPERLLSNCGAETGLPTRRFPYWLARDELAALGVAINRGFLAVTAEEARQHADAVGYPVTVKLSSLSAPHKEASGGVAVCLRTPDEVDRAVSRMLSLGQPFGPGEGVVVEEYVHGVRQAFVGAHRDPEFGPIILVGLGGELAEAYGDIGRASCPVDQERLDAMITNTTFGSVLARDAVAYRGICSLLTTLSYALVDDPTIASLDLNPVLIRADGTIVAVDARIERYATLEGEQCG